MPTTTNLGLPYPGLTDAPNAPAQIQALALALDRQVVNTKATASTTAATSIDLIVSGTITGDGGKKFRVTASFRLITGTVAGDVYDVTLQEGATVLKSFRSALISVANGTNGATIETVLTPSAGAHTYGLSANRVVGTGTLSVYGSATAPIEMTIEQLT